MNTSRQSPRFAGWRSSKRVRGEPRARDTPSCRPPVWRESTSGCDPRAPTNSQHAVQRRGASCADRRRARTDHARAPECASSDADRLNRPSRNCVSLGRRSHHLETVHQAWTAARKAAALPHRLLHDFRRAAARRLTNAGVPQSFAMRVTGHKTPSMFRRYSIVETADMARGLERVAVREEGAKVRRIGHRDGHR